MRLYLLAAASAALLTAACDVSTDTEISATRTSIDDEGRLAAVSSLDCPEREGDLRLASRDAQGRSCFYRTDSGAEVELRLAALDGAGAEATLETLQAQLRPLVPAAASPPEPPRPPQPASGDAEGSHHVDVAGIINVRSQGDQATIKLPGVSIQADDGSARIHVKDKGENVLIDAHDGGATIRSDGGKKGDVRSTFLLASEKPGPSGVRLAGYAARGPAAGPLVIGVVKAKSERDNDDVFDDMEDLVRRNARRR